MCLYSEKKEKINVHLMSANGTFEMLFEIQLWLQNILHLRFFFFDWLIDLNEIRYVYLMLHLNFGPLQRQQLHEKCVGYANLWNAH